MIRILIVDDQNLVQQGIKSLLSRDLDFKVIGTVTDGRNAVQQIAQIHPDVVLLDIEMPGMDGITTTKYINRVSPKTKVIILSSHEEKKYITQALMAGAKGYILKTSLMTDLKQAIKAVNNGYSQIDSRLLAKVFDPQNIKVRKVNSSPNSEVTKTNIDDYVKQQSQNKANSWQTDSSAASSISQASEEHKSENVELDSAIKSKKSEAILSEVKIERSTQNTSSNAFSKEMSDAVVLKQADTNTSKDLNRSNNGQMRSPYIAPQTVLAPARKKSSTRHKRLKLLSLLLKRKTSATVSATVDYGKKLSNRLKKASHGYRVERAKSQLQHYKTKLLLLAKQKKKQPWLWTMGLVILGILLAVILGR